MSIYPISPGTVANPAQVAPPSTDQPAVTAQAAQTTEKAIKAAKTDTVTISPRAVQLASDGDTVAQETKESAADKATENLRGKK